MTRRIHKLQFGVSNFQPFMLPMPSCARIIHVEMQCDFAGMWYIFDDELYGIRIERHFVVRPTGGPIEDGLVHVGTWLDGPFVWHLFEVTGYFKDFKPHKEYRR